MFSEESKHFHGSLHLKRGLPFAFLCHYTIPRKGVDEGTFLCSIGRGGVSNGK